MGGSAGYLQTPSSSFASPSQTSMDETVDKVEITMRKVYIIAIHPIDGLETT
jgi:hypothetical protein